jgi:hypothetical protein
VRDHVVVDTSTGEPYFATCAGRRWPALAIHCGALAEFCRHLTAIQRRNERTQIMKHRYLAQALLAASLGAFAAAGYAQTSSVTPIDQTPGSTATESTAASPPTSGMGATTGTYGTAQAGGMRAPMTSAEIRAYEQARNACDKGPAAGRQQCWSNLTTKYSGVNSKCEKLTGSPLEACIHENSTSN